MPKSYRIRTQVGINKKIDVNLEQDFEFLEILSLKLAQSELYVRQCSDYGVVVGRVSINNGFGIPNAKLSIFIPITAEDETNPIISSIYPYKTVDDINEDGYKYNLLPYKPSYPGHSATGSFPDLEDVLINPTAIEIYDKYYKFTVTTNDSGDFMIFGVPVGSQTLVMNVDLSDIGPFSLSPQDLIRLGIATETQVNGTRFKTSENINILPQIITISKDVIVEPLWGDEDLCQASITRTDFDLTNELQVEIKPTAIFMGSIFSDTDRNTIKKNCKPRLKAGNMCSLVAGPGQILAIRHTIRQDNSGRPILEVLELENNGNVIDENGTWLLDVPMNLDYIVTNEFGEQIFSNDTKKGIPTKAKYRFKIKWNQTPDLSAPVKRATFLVPNAREHGWTSINNDPTIFAQYSSESYQLLKSSYAFSLDWNDYGYSGKTQNGVKMIQDAIDCKDTFYEMSYNKVYTVSQLITRYTKGTLNNRFSAIKAITDTECDSENYKFPSNDGQYKIDFIFILFGILMFIMLPMIKFLVRILHVVARIIEIIINFLEAINKIIKVTKFINKMKEILDSIANFNLPLYSFPDCEICSCSDTINQIPPGLSSATQQSNFTNNSLLADVIDADAFLLNSNPDQNGNDFTEVYQQIAAGTQRNNTTLAFGFRTTLPIIFNTADSNGNLQEFTFGTFSLPVSERINLFNSRAKFFGSGLDTNQIDALQESYLNWSNNRTLGGGVNQIKVCFNKDLNSLNTNIDLQKVGNTYQRTSLLTTNSETRGYHYDNVIVILTEDKYEKSTLLTFENPTKFNDLNLSGQTLNAFGTYSITGTPINTGTTTISVSHTHPFTGERLITKYKISGSSEDENKFLRYPTDIEYFQVLESILVKDMSAPQNDMISNSLFKRALGGAFSQNYSMQKNTLVINPNWSTYNAWDNFENKNSTYITILMRGVDPHSTPQPMKIGLGRIFGDLNHWGYTVEGNFKMNIPLQPNDNLEFGISANNLSNSQATSNALRCTKHDVCDNNTTIGNYAGARLYYPSYHFNPSNIQWKPFNSTSIYNYISTSEDDFNKVAIIPLPADVGTINNNLQNYSYKATTNGKGLRCSQNNFYSRRGTNLTVSNGEAGYIPEECVEGVGFMMLLGAPNLFPYLNNLAYNQRRIKLTTIYWSRKYEPNCGQNQNQFKMTNSTRIVMRSDRLPTSDALQTFAQNSMGLMTNGRFQIYELPEDGIVNTGLVTPSFPFVVNEPEIPESGETPNSISALLNTFSCGSLVPIECYKTISEDRVGLAPSGTCLFTTFERDDRKDTTQYFIQGSCYSLVRPPFNKKENVRNDLDLVNEWFARMNINFGACREVFSHLFVNNWINGTLYMFPFRNTRYFTGINENPPNQPYNKFCKDTVYLHPETFNFYYRSAPYRDSSNEFIGREGTKIKNKIVGNEKNLMYPTTIMDLGPRDQLQKFLSQSGNWDGYIMNKLNSTTFGDTSDLLNIFILSRLANTSFTKFFKSQKGASVLNFFNTRPKRFVDADFAQMVATNSQFGISDYDPEDYPEPSANDLISKSSLFFPVDFQNRDDVVFGIFYTGDSQSRDYIAPNRVVYNPNGQIGNNCAYSYIPLKTQRVPFYLWNIKDNQSKSNIFGTQSNDWSKDIYSYDYQKLDRLLLYQDTKIFKPGNVNIINYNKGWIYNVDTNVTNSATGEANYKAKPGIPNSYNLGAPFYFYFGLKQGSSAFDRFTTKWIDTEELVE